MTLLAPNDAGVEAKSYRNLRKSSPPVADDERYASADSFGAIQNPYLFPLDLLHSERDHLHTSEMELAPRSSETLSDEAEPTRWWLIHTKPRQEKKLAEELRKFSVPHYLPVTKCKSVYRGRTSLIRAPQFPGYLFLQGTAEQRLTALKTNRIVAVHEVDDQAELARHLWDLADLIEKGVPLRIEERLVPGQHVRVKSGLLEDKRGIVMKRAGKTRLFIFINDFLGGVSLEIEPHLLEPY